MCLTQVPTKRFRRISFCCRLVCVCGSELLRTKMFRRPRCLWNEPCTLSARNGHESRHTVQPSPRTTGNPHIPPQKLSAALRPNGVFDLEPRSFVSSFSRLIDYARASPTLGSPVLKTTTQADARLASIDNLAPFSAIEEVKNTFSRTFQNRERRPKEHSRKPFGLNFGSSVGSSLALFRDMFEDEWFAKYARGLRELTAFAVLASLNCIILDIILASVFDPAPKPPPGLLL